MIFHSITTFEILLILNTFQLHARFDEMKVSVSEEKKMVEEQRRQLEEQIADFQRRKTQYETDKMSSGHHTLTLGKLGKKNK